MKRGLIKKNGRKGYNDKNVYLNVNNRRNVENFVDVMSVALLDGDLTIIFGLVINNMNRVFNKLNKVFNIVKRLSLPELCIKNESGPLAPVW